MKKGVAQVLAFELANQNRDRGVKVLTLFGFPLH